MRGGKRKGAGRKPSPNKKVKYGTRLRPDQIEWLREPGRNAAKEIERGIDIRISLERQYPKNCVCFKTSSRNCPIHGD